MAVMTSEEPLERWANLRFTRRQHRHLQLVAATRGVSIAQLVRDLVDADIEAAPTAYRDQLALDEGRFDTLLEAASESAEGRE